MGAISDILSFGDYRRMRAWLLAIAVALIGTQLLAWIGVIPLSKSMYLSPNLNWVGNVIGGLMFGFGMVFAGGCASRNLARVGAGDLRSLVTLIVMGIFAYMSIGGTSGQAITGVSTLAVGSLSAFAAILAGGLLGMGKMEVILLLEA